MGGNFFTDYTKLKARVRCHIGEFTSRCGEHVNVREEIVRCLWFGGHFPQDELKNDFGLRMEIVSPGWWNVEGGPDFIRAEFLMEHAGRIAGDVEVHTRADDWWRHGHHLQPEYNNVALHVVMWDNTGTRRIVKENGEEVPQLTLSGYIEEEIAELADIVDMEAEDSHSHEYTARKRFCTRAVETGEFSPAMLCEFLDAAGDHRFKSKSEKLKKQYKESTLEHILYQNISEALGYKNNRLPFLQIARNLPPPVLREIVPRDSTNHEKMKTTEAAFFGTAGFLDNGPGRHTDAQTSEYISELSKIWNELPARIRKVKMASTHWNMAGSRPANTPLRRLAALATLYCIHLEKGLFRRLAACLQADSANPRRRSDTVMRDALTSTFTELRHPYWSYRYSFRSLPLSKPVALIGEQRAKDILTNVVLPLLLTGARNEHDEDMQEKVFQIWQRLPANRPNRIIKRMHEVLMPDGRKWAGPNTTFRQQQGLQQLYNDCCSTKKGCENCMLRYLTRI